MKKYYFSIICAASIALLAACGGGSNAPKTGNEKVDEMVEEAIEDFKSMNGIEKFDAVLKDLKLSLKDVAPEFEYAEKNQNDKYNFYGLKTTAGNTASALFVKKDGTDVTQEEYEAYVRKVYEATKKVSQDGKNVAGFMRYGERDKALSEWPIDSVLGRKLFGEPWNLVDWNFREDDIIYSCGTDLKEATDTTPASISFKVEKTLQKSLDETLEDAEELLEREDVKKALKDALN